jgi:hypothetical protein
MKDITKVSASEEDVKTTEVATYLPPEVYFRSPNAKVEPALKSHEDSSLQQTKRARLVLIPPFPHKKSMPKIARNESVVPLTRGRLLVFGRLVCAPTNADTSAHSTGNLVHCRRVVRRVYTPLHRLVQFRFRFPYALPHLSPPTSNT